MLLTAMMGAEGACGLQQECDWGIFAEPHISAMCRQQARSSAVSVRCGMTHASSGVAST